MKKRLLSILLCIGILFSMTALAVEGAEPDTAEVDLTAEPADAAVSTGEISSEAKNALGGDYSAPLVEYEFNNNYYTVEFQMDLPVRDILIGLGLDVSGEDLSTDVYDYTYTQRQAGGGVLGDAQGILGIKIGSDNNVTINPFSGDWQAQLLSGCIYLQVNLTKKDGTKAYAFTVRTNMWNYIAGKNDTVTFLYDTDHHFYLYDEAAGEKRSGALPYVTIEQAIKGGLGASQIHQTANLYYNHVKILMNATYTSNGTDGLAESIPENLRTPYENWIVSSAQSVLIERHEGFEGTMILVETENERPLHIATGITIDNKSPEGSNLVAIESVNGETNGKSNESLVILRGCHLIDSNAIKDGNYRGVGVRVLSTLHPDPPYEEALIENEGGCVELDTDCLIEGFHDGVLLQYGVVRLKNMNRPGGDPNISIEKNTHSVTMYHNTYIGKWDQFNPIPKIKVYLKDIELWDSGDIILGSGYYWVKPDTDGGTQDGNSAGDLRWSRVTAADRNQISFENGEDLPYAMGIEFYDPFKDEAKYEGQFIPNLDNTPITDPYPVLRFQKQSVFNINKSTWYFTLGEAVAASSANDELVFYDNTKESGTITINHNLTIRSAYEGEISKAQHDGTEVVDTRGGNDCTATWDVMSGGSGIKIANGATVNFKGTDKLGETTKICGTLTLDANGKGRVIENNGTMNMEHGITLTNGSTSGNGGAVLNNGALSLIGGTISNNSAALGDAIYQNGYFNLSGNPVFSGHADQDVYLPATATSDTAKDGFCVITKAGEFEFTTPLKVTLGNENKNLYDGRNVVESGAETGNKEIADTDLQKFTLTNLTGYDTEYFEKLAFIYEDKDTTPNGNQDRDVLELDVETKIRTADLVITKKVNGTPDQSFLFRVTGDGVDLTVIIPANAFSNGVGSATVKELLIGDYTVTELTDWSWRYEIAENGITAKEDSNAEASGDAIDFKLTIKGETVTFTNTRSQSYWLGGDSFVENVFGAAAAAAQVAE